MAELQICLLGTFQVCWDFTPVAATEWHDPWAVRLVKLLLVRRDGVRAAEAVRLLSHDFKKAQLDAAIASACAVLEPGATVRVRQDGMIVFEPSPRCWIDLDAMMAHHQAGMASASKGDIVPAIMAFKEADALYQGDLLEDVQEPWVEAARSRLRTIYTDILERLAEGHAVLAGYQTAVGFCHKTLVHDPLRESAYQRMMVYYYYLGDLGGAEDAYRACCQELEHAGIAVSEETAKLWDQLRQGRVSAEPNNVAAALMEEARRRIGGGAP